MRGKEVLVWPSATIGQQQIVLLLFFFELKPGLDITTLPSSSPETEEQPWWKS